MKTYLLSGVAALGLLAATAAGAADLPSRKGPVAAPYMPAPMFTWTGFYLGANLGGGWGEFSHGGVRRFIGDPSGFIAGGQVGYNYQVNQFVLGLEADLQYSDMHSGSQGPGAPLISKAEIEYFGTVRGRVGYAFDRFLPYLTGGFAYGNTKIALRPGVTINGIGSDDAALYGWTVGAGLEYAVTNNITVRGEYLYVDLEKKNYFNGGAKIGTDFSVVRAALNYKF